ncbi:MAG: T9SS type A sorting domain-containing protein [Bacteroidetes bacterium]|nr:T9SS type A sorting domain-containing protein [Bacteroidota bacterium]
MKSKYNYTGVLGILMLLTPFYSFSQQGDDNGRSGGRLHHEVQDQQYMSPLAAPHTTAPRIKSTGFTMVQVNVDANGNNIPGDAANEPSMSINPTDPQYIAIGWRQFDNVLSNFRQAGYGYSGDGGLTWTFPGVITPGIFRSDPVLDGDAMGYVYYNSLTSNGGSYSCKVFKSDNGGSSWDAGVDAHGGDKQWMVIDRSGGAGTGNVYSAWNEFFTSCAPGAFIRSTDDGATFGHCTELPGNPYWGTMAIGNNGEVYTTGWSDNYGIVILKSTSARHADSIPVWNLSLVDLDGQLAYGELVNPAGLSGQISIAVDHSGGPANDNVYLLSTIERFSNSDSADVMFTRSTDGGLTWSAPVRVNDDPGTDNYQWFGTMSVAPNGRIDAVWLDTRDSPPGSLLSALYYSYSLNQGISWSVNQKLSPLFDSRIGWPQQAKMGDYISMTSDNNKAYLAWTNTLNSEEDVYFSTITPSTTGITDKQQGNSGIHISAYPCPFSDHTTIDYYLPENNFVTLSLADISGRAIKTIVSSYQDKGAHHTSLSGSGIPRGYYFIRIESGTQSSNLGIAKID